MTVYGPAVTRPRSGTARRVLAVPRAVLGFIGLTAVLIGLLAMHVWAGGHGPTAVHGLHAPPVYVSAPGQPPKALEQPPMALEQPPMALEQPPTAAEVSSDHAGHDGIGPTNSKTPHDSTAEMGLCVLAFMVVALLLFLLPAGSVIPGSFLLRGLPLVPLVPQLNPVPSLIRLCISRT
ncbi:hypothetical protein [Arthrobacter sp.]|uniref:hypothetical protein n=1 Tax=Arthrobacter sp. TaxID=1667 RepID=UPI0028127629|nr:hypothetical protein [Arthrobacter sp.]